MEQKTSLPAKPAFLQRQQEEGWGQCLGEAFQDPQMKGTLEIFEQRQTFFVAWPSARKLIMTAAASPSSARLF